MVISKPSLWLLVTGSRAYPEPRQVREVLAAVVETCDIDMLHGGADGVDTWADQVAQLAANGCISFRTANPATYLEIPEGQAKEMQIRLKSLPGRVWPMVRNTHLVRLSVRRLLASPPGRGMVKVYGFWNLRSSGTLDCLDKAIEAGLDTSLFVPGQPTLVAHWPQDMEKSTRWDQADRENPLRWEHSRTQLKRELRARGIALAA